MSLDDVSRISTIRRALRLRYDGECLSDRLGRNLKLTVNPRYEIGRVHDHEFSSVWSGANDTIEFARFAVGRLDARRPVCLRILSGELLQIVGDQDAGARGLGVTCPCQLPPRGVRVRPCEGRTDEASQVYGRADYW